MTTPHTFGRWDENTGILHTFGRWKEDKVYDERACGKGPSGMRFRNGTESRNLLPLWKRDGGAMPKTENFYYFYG